MTWNWQRMDWPNFMWNEARLVEAERRFLLHSGILIGRVDHLSNSDLEYLMVEAISSEAITTSEIEGEILDRASVQSSIRKQLGLTTDNRRVAPAEQGIAELMVDLYRTAGESLSERMLCNWHSMIMSGRRDLRDIGRYRTGDDPMQIVSGRIDQPNIHFEAPPSSRLQDEMARFAEWFSETDPKGKQPLPAITRAGIAHLYFESIHPFEDGNGRIGRAIAEKALAQSTSQSSFIGLSKTILIRRREYYQALEAVNKQNEVTEWLAWFAGVTLEAEQRTLAETQFMLDKVKLLDRLRGTLNARQEKALLRMFQEGPEGFEGGLNAGKYASITGASPATSTRDLAELTDVGALSRTGEHRGARYHLTVPLRKVKRISLTETGDIIES